MKSGESSSPEALPALFADRDGTLIEEVGYLDDLARMRLIPGVTEAVRRANLAGVPVVAITNQSGIARGYFSEDFVEESAHHLQSLLARGGARLDGHYFCPHHPEGAPPYNIVCDCRKPESGLLRRAAGELGLSLSGSWLVGDRAGDLAAGAAEGVKPILVRTGYGRRTESQPNPGFSARGGRIFDNFPQAADWLLKGPLKRPGGA